MNKEWFNNAMTTIADGAVKYGPDIAIGAGIAGFVLTAILAARAAPKAEKKLARAEVRKGSALSTGEKIKTAGKDYIPAIVAGGLSATSIVLGTRELHKRNAAIMALCAIAETSLSEYKDKVAEVLGKEAEKDISEKVEETKSAKVENVLTEETFMPMKKYPFVDIYSGQPFYSSYYDIKNKVVDLNAKIISGRPVTLNDFYYALGMRPMEDGDSKGWEKTEIGAYLIEIGFGSMIYDIDHNDVRFTINFRNPPKDIDYYI